MASVSTILKNIYSTHIQAHKLALTHLSIYIFTNTHTYTHIYILLLVFKCSDVAILHAISVNLRQQMSVCCVNKCYYCRISSHRNQGLYWTRYQKLLEIDVSVCLCPPWWQSVFPVELRNEFLCVYASWHLGSPLSSFLQYVVQSVCETWWFPVPSRQMYWK